jgi:hypothetical protein
MTQNQNSRVEINRCISRRTFPRGLVVAKALPFLLSLLCSIPLWAQDGPGVSPVPKATDLYVAITGDDKSPGTTAAPFQTLARAQVAVRALQPLNAPLTVWVRGGTLLSDQPACFHPSRQRFGKGADHLRGVSQ